MNHEALREQVIDLALGALAPAAAREVEAHVAGCAGCAAELASLRGTRAALAGLPPLPAPERGEAVLLAAARQAAATNARTGRFALPRWLWGATLGAASAAVVVLLSVQLARSPPPSRFAEGREALVGSAPPPSALEARRAEPADLAPPPLPATASAPASARHREREEGAREPIPEAAPPPPPPARRVAAVRAQAQDDLAAPAAPTAVAERSTASADRETERYAAEVLDAARGVAAKREVAAGPVSVPPPPEPAAKAAQPSFSGQGAAAGIGVPDSARRAAAAPGLPSDVQAFTDCPGERSRTLTRDGAGRLVRRQRIGTVSGVAYAADESFGEDGRLAGAIVRLDGRVLSLDRAALVREGLEPVRGLRLAPTAAAAAAEPPGCGR
jgi:hypothetical protein